MSESTPTRADVLREFSTPRVSHTSSGFHWDGKTWDEPTRESLADEIVRLRALVPQQHERYVRVAYPEMVEMLRDGSQPVTVRIVEHAGGELWLECYAHHCAALRDGGADGQ